MVLIFNINNITMNKIFFLVSVFFALNLSGQKAIIYDSLYFFNSSNGFYGNRPLIIDFNDSLSRDYIFIDSNQSNNVWEFTKISKPGFLISDSVFLTTGQNGDYDTSLFSSFILKLKIDPSGQGKWFSSFGLGFIHAYQTDSAMDGLTIESSEDGGLTWNNDFYNINFGPLAWRMDSIINWDLYTYMPNSAININTGNSNGLIYSRLAWGMLGVKASYDSLLIRVTFRSDNNQSQKAGWAIQKLIVEGNYFETGSINENELGQSFKVYSSGKDIYLKPLKPINQDVLVSVYNLVGQKVFSVLLNNPNQENISLPYLKSGIYLIDISTAKDRLIQKIFLE
jgi:hypothetical protein